MAVVNQSVMDSLLDSTPTFNVEDDPLQLWDKGVLLNEIQRLQLAQSQKQNGVPNGDVVAPQSIQQGTYFGTKMALTEVKNIMDEATISQFDTLKVEPIAPKNTPLDEKKNIYQWSDPKKDFYPPHLNQVPPGSTASVGELFDQKRGGDVQAGFVTGVAGTFAFLIPQQILKNSKVGDPYDGPTLADCEKFNLKWFENLPPEQKQDITGGENLGLKPDWYSDARFAQQQLTGVNPTTLTTAPRDRVDAYINEAGKQCLDDVKQRLSAAKDLYIQDYSYFRKATDFSTNEEFKSIIAELTSDRQPTGKFSARYACASVCIFELNADGRLHPLAITLDYKTSLDDSITLFNKRLHPDDSASEKDDWPWRYAKTCVQTADWNKHEIVVHLGDTHLIEEAVIVAANRTIPEDHLLYQILSPHWYRTLALNDSARRLLVPLVVARLCGFGPSMSAFGDAAAENRALKFLRWSYDNFDFQGKYVPNDLESRGFPTDITLYTDAKYTNCSYARNIYMMWGAIRRFVSSVLSVKYQSDADVQHDSCIKAWCDEIQGPGQIKTFPTIMNLDQLIDAVTMCIHIASPQHTAVNYLQDYYYSFPPAKPPNLCTPLPIDLKTLQGYTEADLIKALPIGEEDAKWKDWLLAAQMPELLSYKVAPQLNLLTYAKSLYNVNKERTSGENKEGFDKIKTAAAELYDMLMKLGRKFKEQSDQQTKGTLEYRVLEPDYTAVSILI